MKQNIVVVIISLLCSYCSLNASSESVANERARSYGAQGSVILCVKDSTGSPVEGAEVNVGFYNPHTRGLDVVGTTDENGCFVATGTTLNDLHYTVTKDGFYKTEGDYVFDRPDQGSTVKNGRWQPWNPVVPVGIKEYRNPASLYVIEVNTAIPEFDKPVGFDLEAGDWITPYGRGEHSDIIFVLRTQIEDYWTGKKELEFSCSNLLDGFYVDSKQVWSEFHSSYYANRSGYEKTLHLITETTKEEKLVSKKIDRLEYVVYRVRTGIDIEGNIESAHYGKIYGPIDYGRGKNLDQVRFTYYFNPRPNDRNLEFDPAENLFDVSYKKRISRP